MSKEIEDLIMQNVPAFYVPWDYIYRACGRPMYTDFNDSLASLVDQKKIFGRVGMFDNGEITTSYMVMT